MCRECVPGFARRSRPRESPIEDLRPAVVLHVALEGEASLLHHPAGGRVRGLRVGDEVAKAVALRMVDETARHLGGEAAAPPLGEERVPDLHFLATADLDPTK